MDASESVLLVARMFPPCRGGTATVYHHLCRTLSPAVTAMTWRHDPAREREFDGAQGFSVVRIPGLARLAAAVAGSPLARFDALVEHGAVRAVTALWLARHLRRTRPRVVCIGELRLGYWIAAWVRAISDARVVFYTHGEELADQWRSRFVGTAHIDALRAADGVVAVSEFARARLLALGVSPERIQVIHSGVDLGRFSPGPASRSIVDRFGLAGLRVLLTVGRPEPRKGQDTVIRALPAIAERVPDVVYLMVGGGPSTAPLEALAERLGVRDRVRFGGAVSEEDLVACYRACDVFVMANRTLDDGDTEGYGLVFLEAGACEKPVVGGRAGGAPEAVIEGVTGLLVDGTSVDETAAALVRLLTDRGLAETMAAQGRARAQTQGWDATGRAFRAFCGGLRSGR